MWKQSNVMKGHNFLKNLEFLSFHYEELVTFTRSTAWRILYFVVC